jgi:hypothetical protein
VIRTGAIGAGVAALVVLLARAVAYATEPTPAARVLEQRAGGPALPLLALVSLTLAASLAVAVCWLAAMAVRERALLERRTPEGFPVGRTLATALSLAAGTSLAGGLLEAYLHWRAGLGWHGLHCVFGPVHRDLLPLESGFSLVGAALISASQHVVTWMRRTFARLRAVLPPLRLVVQHVLPRLVDVTHGVCLCSAPPRAPPVFA